MIVKKEGKAIAERIGLVSAAKPLEKHTLTHTNTPHIQLCAHTDAVE